MRIIPERYRAQSYKVLRKTVRFAGTLDIKLRGHPVPLALAVAAPICGLAGLPWLGIGLYVGCLLYILTYIIDRFAAETLGDSE